MEQVGHLPPATYAHAMTLDLENMAAYVVGGWGTGQHCQVSQIHLPSDICSLWSHSKFKCLQHSGCGFCGLYSSSPQGQNVTKCHSNMNIAVEGAAEICKEANSQTPDATITSLSGIVCSDDGMLNRDCKEFETCSTCLATWPAHNEVYSTCYWCDGKCISIGKECRFSDSNVTNVNQCPEKQCQATDCHHCQNMVGCVWSQRTRLADRKQHTAPIEWGKKFLPTLTFLPTYVSKSTEMVRFRERSRFLYQTIQNSVP